MKRFNFLYLSPFFFCLLSVSMLMGGDEPKKMSPQEYINRFKADAIRDMLKTGVPASITLAQGMFESENGNSKLANEANNHFGIKCHKEWSGPSFIKDDDTKNECFRKYSSVLESYDDHSNFLRTRERYKFLFDYDVTDYKKWAHGLKKAGYATNPEYASKLIKIIEENNLNELDFTRDLATIEKFRPVEKTAVQKSPVIEKKAIPAPAALALNNNTKYLVAKRGDSWLSLAQQQEMMLWQLLKYNDADKGSSLAEGEIVYLKPKKSFTKTDFHVVKEGESMRSISQLYGIKMKKLYNRNHIALYTEPAPGTKLSLNKTIQNNL